MKLSHPYKNDTTYKTPWIGILTFVGINAKREFIAKAYVDATGTFEFEAKPGDILAMGQAPKIKDGPKPASTYAIVNPNGKIIACTELEAMHHWCQQQMPTAKRKAA